VGDDAALEVDVGLGMNGGLFEFHVTGDRFLRTSLQVQTVTCSVEKRDFLDAPRDPELSFIHLWGV
jgi:hypothetical protein